MKPGFTGGNVCVVGTVVMPNTVQMSSMIARWEEEATRKGGRKEEVMAMGK